MACTQMHMREIIQLRGPGHEKKDKALVISQVLVFKEEV